MKPKPFRLYSLLFVFGALSALMSCSPKAQLPKETQSPKKSAPVPAAKSQAEASGEEYRLSGQVSSLSKILMVFKTQGSIDQIFAKPGMHFKKGAVLAQLDLRNVQLQVDLARFRAEQADIQAQMALRDFNIEKRLSEEDATSAVSLENMRLGYDNARLAADIAKANQKIAEKAFEDAHLKAPFDCVVTRQMKYVGEPALGGDENGATLEIYEAKPAELIFNAPEPLLSQIKVGQKLDIAVPSLGLKALGKVTRFVPIISDQTRTFLVIAQLDKPDSRIVPGYFVEATLALSPR